VSECREPAQTTVLKSRGIPYLGRGIGDKVINLNVRRSPKGGEWSNDFIRMPNERKSLPRQRFATKAASISVRGDITYHWNAAAGGL
jgi:hypothetical protein